MFREKGIFIKVFAGIFLSSLIIVMIIGLVFMNREQGNLENSLIRENQLRAKIISQSIESDYLINRYPFGTLKQLALSQEMVFWRIITPDGEIVLADENELIGKRIKPIAIIADEIIIKDSYFYKTRERVKVIIHPLRIEGVAQPWSFYLGVSLESLETAKKEIMTAMLELFGIAFLISLSFSLFLAKRFTDPIKQLASGIGIVAKGNLDYHIRLNTNDEIEELSENFNQMTKELKQQKEREQDISKMKSEFISIAAHQLRTPLASLKWALELMQTGELGRFNKQQEEHLKQCQHVNEEMIVLVNGLLNVARIEEGRFLYEYSLVQIEELIKEIIKDFEEKIKTRNIKFSFHKPRLPLSPVRVDAAKIKLAIGNLLDNALKYTLEGGDADISVEEKDKKIIVKVRDKGIGIPESQQQKIFQKFFRAENVSKVKTYGSGLGLFIVKNIIEKHKGRIWFESKEGEGTTFYITIPIKENRI